MAQVFAQFINGRGIFLGIAAIIWLVGLVSIARRKKLRSIVLYVVGAAFVAYYEVHMALYWLGIGIVLVMLGWVTSTDRDSRPFKY